MEGTSEEKGPVEQNNVLNTASDGVNAVQDSAENLVYVSGQLHQLQVEEASVSALEHPTPEQDIPQQEPVTVPAKEPEPELPPPELTSRDGKVYRFIEDFENEWTIEQDEAAFEIIEDILPLFGDSGTFTDRLQEAFGKINGNRRLRRLLALFYVPKGQDWDYENMDEYEADLSKAKGGANRALPVCVKRFFDFVKQFSPDAFLTSSKKEETTGTTTTQSTSTT